MIELPREIWHEIFLYIPGHDKLPLRLVSKYFDYVITHLILQHAHYTTLQMSIQRPHGIEYAHVKPGLKSPIFTSVITRVLPEERTVEYLFGTPLSADDFEILIRLTIWVRKPSHWQFNFLQSTGSWSWSFTVLWSKKEDKDNVHTVLFSTESTNCPAGVAVSYAVDADPPVVDGLTIWSSVKVPLKVLAHQFAGNLGERE